MKSYLVLGLGAFGSSIARTLHEQGYEVLAIDKDEEKVQEISQFVTHAVSVDVLDEDSLKELGISNFDVAVVSMGTSIQASIMATLILKELGVKHIVAKAISNLHGRLLVKIGADDIVYPEREMGERVAKRLSSDNVLDYIELSDEYCIMEVLSPKELVGKKLIETNLRSKYGITVMAIKKDKGKNVRLFPRAEQVIYEGDSLVLVGSEKNVQKFKNKNLD